MGRYLVELEQHAGGAVLEAVLRVLGAGLGHEAGCVHLADLGGAGRAVEVAANDVGGGLLLVKGLLVLWKGEGERTEEEIRYCKDNLCSM